MCSKNSRLIFKVKRRCSFTLVEIMVAMTIGVLVLGGATAASVYLYKDFSSVTAYRNVHPNARKSLAYMSRDIRAGIGLSAFSADDVTFTKINTSGGTNTIRYFLSNNNLMRSETSGSTTTTSTLTDNVTAINFERWTNPGTPASTLADTFELRVSMSITNTTVTNSSFRASTDLLQTRILMRNKTS